MDLFKAVVLICTAAVPREDCDPEVALDVIVAPEASTVGYCGLMAQALIANSAIAQNLTDDTYMKILCTTRAVQATMDWPPPDGQTVR